MMSDGSGSEDGFSQQLTVRYTELEPDLYTEDLMKLDFLADEL
jgi:hypothetical protein